jgi:glutathione synthase
MKIAVQMDHPATLRVGGDSTIALMEVMQERGDELWFYHPAHLSSRGAEIIATQAQRIRLTGGGDPWYELSAPQELALEDMEVVLLRQDPPFDMTYLTTTYLLERLPASVRVVNNPTYVRNHPEKIAILDFAEFIPPTIITAQEDEILRFLDECGEIVIKPLYGFGGRSVFRFAKGDSNLLSLLEQHRERSFEPLMAQAFLPEVKDQDVRVILIDGKVEAAVGRIPAAGEIRANFRVGGTAAAVELNPRRQAICEAVGAKLKANGVLFAGLDLIGDYLTEVNITSPTGIRPAQQLYGTNPAKAFRDALEG